jgi:adenosylcobinamide kinase/adenosylcobinamide-phosphate guanylyltransferase
MSPLRLLVIGCTRSGKSRYAEERVLRLGLAPVYIATGAAGDAEMAVRIAGHRMRRGPEWRTVEEPLNLPERIINEAQAGKAVLVDCLTLWLSNLMVSERGLDSATSRLIEALVHAEGPVVVVSNEVGGGIVPDNALAREFADAQGELNQRVARAVDEVVLVAAGLPLVLKSPEKEMVR